MSLINDALKRAKQAQAASPPEISHLRPAEPAPPSARRAVLVIALLTGGAMGIALLLAWRAFLGPHPPGTDMAAGNLSQNALVKRTQPQSIPASPQNPPERRNSGETPSMPPDKASALEKFSQPSTPSPERNRPEVSPASFDATAVASTPATHDAVSASVPATPAAPSRPEPFKLQGIVFSPKRPAAMIAGKMLFVGDKLGEWRISAITPESATLITTSQTNTLTLSQ